MEINKEEMLGIYIAFSMLQVFLKERDVEMTNEQIELWGKIQKELIK